MRERGRDAGIVWRKFWKKPTFSKEETKHNHDLRYPAVKALSQQAAQLEDHSISTLQAANPPSSTDKTVSPRSSISSLRSAQGSPSQRTSDAPAPSTVTGLRHRNASTDSDTFHVQNAAVPSSNAARTEPPAVAVPVQLTLDRPHQPNHNSTPIPSTVDTASIDILTIGAPYPRTLGHAILIDALEKLDSWERDIIGQDGTHQKALMDNDAADIQAFVQKSYETAQRQKSFCEGRKWHKPSNTAGRIVKLLHRFKSMGDAVAAVDPIHIGLPWMGISTLLEIAVSQYDLMMALLSSMQFALSMVERLDVYSFQLRRLYNPETPAVLEKSRKRFCASITESYAFILKFFAAAIRSYRDHFLKRMWQSFYKGTTFSDFESKGAQQMASLDLDARSCKDELQSSQLDDLRRWHEELESRLSSLDEVQGLKAALDAMRDDNSLGRLTIVESALWDSRADGAKEDPSTCLHGTRAQVLEIIYQWMSDSGNDQIFWLRGIAGTGKSTIARTVAHHFDNANVLGASFFFERGGGDRSVATHFFSTITRQIIDRVPQLKPFVLAALQQDSLLEVKGFERQAEKLILQPLLQLVQSGIAMPKLVIVVDALDECEPVADVPRVVTQLAHLAKDGSSHLRIFVTSRPEFSMRSGVAALVRRGLTSVHDLMLESLPGTTIEHDIALYLNDRFKEIVEHDEDEGSFDPLPAGWPGQDSIQTLTRLAAPLFIFAAIACRWIAEMDCRERLQAILAQQNNGSVYGLSATYQPILQEIVRGKTGQDRERAVDEFRQLVGIIVLAAEPLSPQAIHDLCGLSLSHMSKTLKHLHSVLEISNQADVPVRLYHASFRDYLLDSSGEKDAAFCIDEHIMQKRLAQDCLKVLRRDGTIRRDLLRLGDDGYGQDEADAAAISTAIAVDVAYACSYWAWHVCRCGKEVFEDHGLMSLVLSFLKTHLLHWLEALSWLGRLATSIAHLAELRKLAERHSELFEFLNDAHHFVVENRNVMAKWPLQIYCSALVFAPESSIIRHTFKKERLVRFTFEPVFEQDWSSEMIEFESHERVCSLAFSADGLSVSASETSGTMRTWNLSTGLEMECKKDAGVIVSPIPLPSGHLVALNRIDRVDHLVDLAMDTEILKLSYASDRQVVSGNGRFLFATERTISGDRLDMWDIPSGRLVKTLDYAHEHEHRYISGMAVSHDGSLLVTSTLHDYTANFWDTTTGTRTHQFKEEDYIDTIALSMDGQMLAVSSRRRVKLYSCETSNLLWAQEFEATGLQFSPDGKILAARNGTHGLNAWDTRAGACLLTISKQTIHIVVFSHDSAFLAAASRGRHVHVWGLTDGLRHNPKVIPEEHQRNFTGCVALAPNGSWLAQASNDRMQLWKITSSGLDVQGEPMRADSQEVHRLAFSARSRRLAWLEFETSRLRVFSLEPFREIWTSTLDKQRATAITFANDEQEIWMLTWYGHVLVHRIGTDGVNYTHRLQSYDYVTAVPTASSIGHGLCATGFKDGGIGVWNLATGERLVRFDTNGIPSRTLFSANGNYVHSDVGWFSLPANHGHSKSSNLPIVSLSGQWIRIHGRDSLWLPSEYKGVDFAIHDNVLVLGPNQHRKNVTTLAFI